MSVKQANVALDDIQWGLLPESWPLLVKEDWQNKTNGINETAEVANEANVTANNERDRNDVQDTSINDNSKSILLVEKKVSVIDRKVDLIAIDVSKNKQDIATNKQDISDNKQAIDTNKQNLETHEQLNSAHGVTGDNVGTEDYAQELVGGVVLLAGNIAELTNYAAPSAPAAYDQAEEQAFRDGAQSQLNDIISKVNEIIKGQIASKQMDTL